MRPKDPFIGREILGGQFQILEKIGTGGMGSVYKASQPAMNRMVAIKILHPKLAGRKDLTSRFRREARAMSQLTHPNTAKVFMYGEAEEDGSLYIVMEMLEGKNLKVKGDIIGHEYTIERDGDTIAEISQKRFHLRDTYGIEVRGDVDPALVISVAVAVESLNE